MPLMWRHRNSVHEKVFCSLDILSDDLEQIIRHLKKNHQPFQFNYSRNFFAIIRQCLMILKKSSDILQNHQQCLMGRWLFREHCCNAIGPLWSLVVTMVQWRFQVIMTLLCTLDGHSLVSLGANFLIPTSSAEVTWHHNVSILPVQKILKIQWWHLEHWHWNCPGMNVKGPHNQWLLWLIMSQNWLR